MAVAAVRVASAEYGAAIKCDATCCIIFLFNPDTTLLSAGRVSARVRIAARLVMWAAKDGGEQERRNSRVNRTFTV